ncbi:hypothetical protein [Nitratifractor sp.]
MDYSKIVRAVRKRLWAYVDGAKIIEERRGVRVRYRVTRSDRA